jgi:CRP-like cAMP-binding protein
MASLDAPTGGVPCACYSGGADRSSGDEEPSVDPRAQLRSVPLFREFSDADADAVMSVLRVRHFQSGDEVFRQGDMGEHMVIVAAGRLRVEVDDGKGHRSDVGAIQAGEIVGEMAALDPAPRNAFVIAASEAVVYELSRAGLQTLLGQAPGASAAIVAHVIAEVTRRLRETDRRIERLLNPGAQAPQKVALAQGETGSAWSRLWSRLRGG